MEEKLELNLLINAIDSLEQGLESYSLALNGKERAYKHAVLNFAMYIELSFKYFISSVHTALIFEEAFTEKKLRKTISLSKATSVLKHLEFFEDLEDKKIFSKDIDWLRKKCNEIKHYKVDNLSTDKFKKMIGKILFTLDMLYNEKDVSIVNNLIDLSGFNLDKFYTDVIDEYKHEILIAEKKAEKLAQAFVQSTKDDVPNIDFDDGWIVCPDCGQHSFVVIESENKYKCTYCGNESNICQCEWCYKTFPISDIHESIIGSIMCSDSCVENFMEKKV
jgi:hypothetical protein